MALQTINPGQRLKVAASGSSPKTLTAQSLALGVGAHGGRWTNPVVEGARARQRKSHALVMGRLSTQQPEVTTTVLLRPGTSLTVRNDVDVLQPDGLSTTVDVA